MDYRVKGLERHRKVVARRGAMPADNRRSIQNIMRAQQKRAEQDARKGAK